MDGGSEDDTEIVENAQDNVTEFQNGVKLPPITEEGRVRLKLTCNYCLEEIKKTQTYSVPCFIQKINLNSEGDDDDSKQISFPLLSSCSHIMHHECYNKISAKFLTKKKNIWCW